MTPERWHQIDKLLERTLEEEPEERADFLDNACADDSELRREVEALLTAHQQAGSFIEAPARVAATAGLAEPLTQSIQGRQLGPYTISSLLGAGGMGEVYLARDTRLDRPVALKMLPPGMTSDPVANPRENGTPILFHDFASGKTKHIATRGGVVEFGMTVSPDEQWILFTQLVSQSSDLMLVENFR